ncbi:MAG: DUF1298 domain-containing protein [Actinobacteria bacterium]|nr:DUF1298 domain-containing protein [Actinomycetota bacterium]
MSDTEALMWSLEKDPALRSTITVLFVFDRTIDRDVLSSRFERISRVVPKLRQRVRTNTLSAAPPRWETDPFFDLAFHLWWVRAPGKATMRDVLSLAEPITMSGFDRARPLWRALVVEGLPAGRSAIIFKLHHSITDGVGGIQLQLQLLDLEADAPERGTPEPPEVHVLSQPERFADAIDHQTRQGLGLFTKAARVALDVAQEFVQDPLTTLRDGAGLAGSISRVVRPTAYPLSPLMTERSLSVHFDTLRFDGGELKAAAKAAGGTLNDAFVAGIARGMHRYHVEHGVDCDELRFAIPINLRAAPGAGEGGSGDEAGNAFVPARLELPIDITDPIAMMHAVHDRVDEARHEPANELVDGLSGLINRLPTAAITPVFLAATQAVDVTASNVPGPPVPMYLSGAELESQIPFGPLGGAAVNITLLSYVRDVNLGIVSDPAAVTDPNRLTACLAAGFEEILAVGR